MDCTVEETLKAFLPAWHKDIDISAFLENQAYREYFMTCLRDRYSHGEPEGVSIVTCTNKTYCMDNIFENYQNQVWGKKELILVLNRDDLDIHQWQKKAERYDKVHIYQQPQGVSLGSCYNFSINKANYDYLAIFDDDDYYAPNYLTDLMYAFQYTDADIIGKLTHFVYLEEKQTLALRNPFNEYVYLCGDSFLDGGKKISKRKVFDSVRFRDVSNFEDVFFCRDSMDHGFKIFSADKYNLAYIRKRNKALHTWKENDDGVLAWNCSFICHTNNYRTGVVL